MRNAIEHAVAGDTSRLGRLLAPFGIRYVVTVEHLAPAPAVTPTVPISAGVVRALGTQLDLERVEGINEAVTVYRNNS